MEKFERNIKESIDEIQIPKEKLQMSIDQAIDIAKNQKPKRKQKLIMSMASILMIGIVGVILLTLSDQESTQQGEGEHVVSLEQIGEYYHRAEQEGNIKSVDLVAEADGIKVAIHEILYDQNQLAFAFEITSDSVPLLSETQNIYYNMKVYIDGNEVPIHKTGPLYENSDQHIIDYVFIEYDSLNFNFLDLSQELFADTVNWEVTIESLYGIEGNWTLSEELTKQNTSDLIYEEIDFANTISENTAISLQYYREHEETAIFEGWMRTPKEKNQDHAQVAYSYVQDEAGMWITQGHKLYSTQYAVEYNVFFDEHKELIENRTIHYDYDETYIGFAVPKENDSFKVVPFLLDYHFENREGYLLQENSSYEMGNYSFDIKGIQYLANETIVTVQPQFELEFFPYDALYVFNEVSKAYYAPEGFKVKDDQVQLIFPAMKESVTNLLYPDRILEVHEDLILDVNY
ncbi:DUF4179 domain-containing protein [Alkalihalobacillus trypoxylicola]|uniref:DUF4179 domain-containing protein n=1 Tax=Alkalihalobacillus trypoxylicola TaxID=519424 RepID=A0A162D0L2_9BACI|nr:DUF4179 domain-containing protein [Alkalihalobacillus trypoxylicola]KYG27606.1 hypothetical protein AZF04_10445 [Alkalihalobacillus trypoxylicola]